MAKLYFRYGAMGSSKTANALMVRFNYLEKGKKVEFLKPDIENRDGEMIVRSRIGLEAECKYVSVFLKKFLSSPYELDAIIIDEAHFMKPKEVEKFGYIVDHYDIPVICYGLRTDFQTKLFPGAKRLFELADMIEQIPTICYCGKKAQVNARISKGKIVTKGEQVMMGGNESYVSLCRKHYYEGIDKNKESDLKIDSLFDTIDCR